MAKHKSSSVFVPRGLYITVTVITCVKAKKIVLMLRGLINSPLFGS